MFCTVLAEIVDTVALDRLLARFGVDLSGARTRVRTGAACLLFVVCVTIPVARVLEVHLPPAQVGVVLAGGVRAGIEVVTNSGAREPMLL